MVWQLVHGCEVFVVQAIGNYDLHLEGVDWNGNHEDGNEEFEESARGVEEQRENKRQNERR